MVVVPGRDDWHGWPRCFSATLGRMRRLRTEAWADIVMLAVACGVALPALLGYGGLRVPQAAWAAMFVAFGAGTVTVMLAGRCMQLIGFSVCVAAAWAMVLTASPGLLPILLVVTAAMSAYVVPIWVGLLVVMVNTCVVALSAALEITRSSSSGMPSSSAPPAVPVALAPSAAVALAATFYLLIQLATLLSTLTLLREQRLREELAVANTELRASNELLAESARAAERLRISRDLHDLLGHQLTALTLQLETARQVEGAAVQRHVDTADAIARELLRDVRATVSRLRVQAPDLERALRRIADAVPGIRVLVNVAAGVRADEQVSAAFVRATQEVITNAVRHSSARELRIEIAAEASGTVFEAIDDGVGAALPVLGNGLSGLRERFGELGGSLEIDGSSGFRVVGTVPAV